MAAELEICVELAMLDEMVVDRLVLEMLADQQALAMLDA